ncbi:MAG TPA: hypothetical protein VG889_17460 [Rhizomicrobium sp.]|nr:hypothetical protein [Rhizomicrobium sp.]
MHEFKTFVYLDMEKTGSTFISRLLNKFSTEAPLVQSHHEPLGADYDPKKFYFISVRNPLDSYLSLYSFGCQEQGKVFARLRARGYQDLYDGTAESFAQWLTMVMKPMNAKMLGDMYNRVGIAELVGLQSWRYLRLAVGDAEAKFKGCESQDDVRRIYEENKLPTFVVRHENFVEDLCKLIEGPLAYAIGDVEGALAYARETEPLNASTRVDKKGDEGFRIRRRQKARLAEREWLMAELFGY